MATHFFAHFVHLRCAPLAQIYNPAAESIHPNLGNIMKRLVAEALGTFVLVAGGCGSAILAAAFPGLGIGFTGVALSTLR